MENNMHNIQAENQKCFDVVEKIKKYYIEDELDISSVVASYIFDVPYDDCGAYSIDGGVRRYFAKELLLANKSFDEIYDDVQHNLFKSGQIMCGARKDIKALIRRRFPYTSKALASDNNRTFEDEFTESCTFIASILGYCRMCDFIHEHELSYSENCVNKETKSDLF